MKIKNKLNVALCGLIIIAASVSIVFSISISKKYGEVTYINNEDDLDKIRNNLSGRFVINADTGINITKPWVPIGTLENPFTGYIDFNYRIINMYHGYDQEYIINSAQSSQLNLGFFGVNNGVIKHSNFNDYIFCDNLDWESPAINNLKKLNYGVACAINNGYLTGVKCYVKAVNIPKSIEEINIGGICAVNSGQLQGCSLNSNLSVSTCSSTNVGCLCGVQEKSGVIKYCYNSGRSYYTLSGGESNSSFCVGLCKGGNINNVGLSYPSDISTRNTSRIQTTNNDSLVSFGALIGKARLESDLEIKNIVCDLELENSYVENFVFGYISGTVDNRSFRLRVSNVCISGKANNEKIISTNHFGLLFGLFDSNNQVTYTNIYYYNFSTDMEHFDYFGYKESFFSDLSLFKLKFDEAIWVKGKYHFYLNYAKIENH